jgi:hypothetical protein
MLDACCHEMMNTQSYWWAVMSVLPIVSRIRHFKQQFLLRHYISYLKEYYVMRAACWATYDKTHNYFQMFF